MLLGPIFTADVVTGARRLRNFVLRVLYATILFLLLWMNYEEAFGFGWAQSRTPIQQAAVFASEFFATFSITQLLAVLLVAPALSATSIAVERERRTIEYLFATDLTNGEIVLSKLAARLLQVACLTLAGVPILSIAMLMGGIAPAQLVMVLVITLSSAVTASVLGLAVSVSAPRAREALGRVYVILFALLVLPIVLKEMFSSVVVPWQTTAYDWIAPVNEVLIDANPVTVLWQALSVPSSIRGNLAAAWSPIAFMLAYHLILAVALAGYSVWAVRRVYLNAAGKLTNGNKLRLLRSRLVPDESPMIWKETFVGSAGTTWGIAARLASLFIVLAVLGPMVWMFFTEPSADSFLEMSTSIGTLVACGGLLITAGLAAASVSGEKERDTWLTLLSTPLEAREIVTGKMIGTLSAQRSWLALIGMVWLLEIFKSPETAVAVFFTAGTLAILAVFATSLGTFLSLQARNSTRAIGATLAILITVGGGYFLCCGVFVLGGAGPGAEAIILAPLIPFLLACPTIVAVTQSPHVEGELIFAYILGNIGYLAAGFVLAAMCVAQFDRLAGRSDIGPEVHKPRQRPDPGPRVPAA